MPSQCLLLSKTLPGVHLLSDLSACRRWQHTSTLHHSLSPSVCLSLSLSVRLSVSSYLPGCLSEATTTTTVHLLSTLIRSFSRGAGGAICDVTSRRPALIVRKFGGADQSTFVASGQVVT